MDRIIDLLIASKFLEKGWKSNTLYFFIGIFIILVCILLTGVFLDISWIDYTTVDILMPLITYIGILLALLFLISLSTEGAKALILKKITGPLLKHEKVLFFIFDNTGLTSKEIISGYIDRYKNKPKSKQETLYFQQINKLETLVENNISNIRTNANQPFIKKDNQDKYSITKYGHQYIRQNLNRKFRYDVYSIYLELKNKNYSYFSIASDTISENHKILLRYSTKSGIKIGINWFYENLYIEFEKNDDLVAFLESDYGEKKGFIPTDISGNYCCYREKDTNLSKIKKDLIIQKIEEYIEVISDFKNIKNG